LRWGYLPRLELAGLLPLDLFQKYIVLTKQLLMDGLFLGPKRTYEDFKKQIPSDLLPDFNSIREFCLSLGSNVVEDIRAHRVVFGKSLSFRWFVDLEPDQQIIIVKIQRDRKEPFNTTSVKPNQDISELKKIILDAYNTIR
jgi:hypothetical protein